MAALSAVAGSRQAAESACWQGTQAVLCFRVVNIFSIVCAWAHALFTHLPVFLLKKSYLYFFISVF